MRVIGVIVVEPFDLINRELFLILMTRLMLPMLLVSFMLFMLFHVVHVVVGVVDVVYVIGGVWAERREKNDREGENDSEEDGDIVCVCE